MKGVGIYNVDSPTILQDSALLEENLTRILLTMPGERVGNPTFGCRFKAFLFDQSIIMKEEIMSEIATAIGKWEPRVTVQAITLTNLDANTLAVKVEVIINETLEVFTLEKVVRI